MKKILLIASIVLFSIECKKDTHAPQYGCEYGVNKTTGQRGFIFCVIHSVYNAGNDQAAADAASDAAGVHRVDVSVLANYDQLEWIANQSCNCQ